MELSVATTRALVEHNAAAHGDVAFLNYDDELTTYAELDQRTTAFANYLLETGIGPGDVVAYMLENSAEVFVVLLGTQKIGAIASPISCWLGAREVEYVLSDSHARLLVIDPAYVPIATQVARTCPGLDQIVVNAAPPVECDFAHAYLSEALADASGDLATQYRPDADAAAALMYTSGTTGKPKGVLLAHRAILSGAHMKVARVPTGVGDRVLCVLPLFHSGGLNDLAFPSIYAAATIVLRRSFSASEFWESVERRRINAFYIVPTMWNILLRAPESETVDTSSVRFAVSGAAPIPPEQLEECRQRFGIPILEGYGTTENAGGITVNTLERSKWGSVGTALDGLEVAVVDDAGKRLPAGEVGEITVWGDTVMLGYLNRPDATAEAIVDGGLRTGDLGHFDGDGFLFIADRVKDLIIRGGVNVYPTEIENVISEIPGVEAVAVIAEPDDKYGQVAKACVIAAPHAQLDADAITSVCADELADYKIPASVVFRSRLPRNAVGKVVKRELIAELADEATAEPVPCAHLFEDMPARFLPEKAAGIDASVAYDISGGGGGRWTVRVKDGAISLEDGFDADATVRLLARDRDYHDIATGVIDGVTAVVTGKLTVDGDAAFMATFRELFRPIEGDPEGAS